jgi:DnaJ-class molecular chaperone
MSNKYYTILELQPNASDDDIKKAYKKLALKYHPDRNSDSGAEAKFKEISDAYQMLTNKSTSNISSHNINPNDLFATFFNMQGGINRMPGIPGIIPGNMPGNMHGNMPGMPGGIQINFNNIPINRTSVTTQIINGQKIETTVEVQNGVVRKKTRITQL